MASPLEIPVETTVPLEDFNRWMVSEQKRVFLLCYRMLQDRDEADTTTQDTFLKAYRAIKQPSAQPVDDYTKWVTRIAVNTCLDKLRSRTWKFWKKRPKSDDEALILEFTASKRPDAEDQYFAGQIQKRLDDALEMLSPKQRAVFALRHYEDRRLDEIAEIMNLEVGTVKAHMARALAKLRNLLEDLYIESESRRHAHGGTR